MYARIRAIELCQLQFTHLYSEVLTASLSRSICGYTEWTATHFRATTSLAWDWVLQSDGTLLISGSNDFRSNIMLVSDKGYDFGPKETAACCAGVVETIPWRDAVFATLNKGSH